MLSPKFRSRYYYYYFFDFFVLQGLGELYVVWLVFTQECKSQVGWDCFTRETNNTVNRAQSTVSSPVTRGL